MYTDDELLVVATDGEESCIEWLEALTDAVTRPVRDASGSVHLSKSLFGAFVALAAFNSLLKSFYSTNL